MKVVTACKLSLLSLLALILYTNANIEEIKFPGNHEEFELLKKFHETWDNSKPLKYVDHEVFVDVPLKNNAATNLGGNYGEGCDVPGYTGQYCESPICANTNLDEDNHSQDPTDVMIDFGHYPVCNVPMPLYYDVSMLSFKVEIHAGGAHSPIMVLYNSTGAIIAPSKVEQFEMSRVIYYFTPQQPGVYQLSPNTDIPSSGCYIYVNSLAYSNIHMGFIPHTANDLIAPERNDSPNTRSYQGQLNTIVAHPINIRYPGNIATVALYEQFNLLTRPQKLAPRYGCEFNHFYNAFYCYRTGTYFAKFTGYDFFGNKYKRVKAFVCEVNPHPPTVAPPTPPVTSCQNNGTLIDNGDGTSSCFCVGPFSGPACGVATCYNGALALPDGTCQCTDNFMGPNCADVLCFPDSGITIQEEFYTPIFVIRVRSQLRTILQQISTQLNNLNTFFQNDPKWFSHFGVVIFNNNGTTLPSKFYDNVADLSDDLLAYSATADNTGGCFDMTFEALDIALNVFILGNKSPIYVISDALPSDPDYLELTSELDSFYLSPIYFIQLEPSVASGCQAFDYYTPGWRALETLAMRSSGNVFFIANNEYGTFGTFFYQHMANTYFMSELMYVDTQRVCANQPKYIFVGIDGDFHQLTVVATGVGLSLQLTTPEGNNAQFDTLYISQNNYMWRLRGLEKGNWQINVIAGDGVSPCEVRVYSTIEPNVVSWAPHYRLTYGFSPSPKLDIINRQPVIEQQNSFVGKLSNFYLPPNNKIRAELVIYENRDAGKMVSFAANGLWRDGCIFNFYFPPYICHFPNEALTFTMFVNTDDGIQLQRAGSMYCANYVPTQVPPGTCQQGGFSQNGTCVCPSTWQGQFCQTPVCQNGGTPNRFGGCTCPPAVAGDNCEILLCTFTNPSPPEFQMGRSITFVLDTSNNNLQFLNSLVTYITPILRDIFSHSNSFIDKMNVISYDDKGPSILATGNIETTNFVSTAFKAAQMKSAANTPGCFPGKQWEALRLAEQHSEDGSLVYLFASSLPNEDMEVAYVDAVFNNFLRRRLTLNAWFSATAPATYMCDGNYPQVYFTKHLAEESLNGDFYDISADNYLNVVKVIPGFIDDNLIYRKKFDECRGTSCFVWFPIDSHTQNAVIKIKGPVLATPYTYHIQKPDGSVITSANLNTLIDDTATGLKILEIRKECPDGWGAFGFQYCIKVNTAPRTWAVAQADCAASNGFMVDATYVAKDQALDYIQAAEQIPNMWLGLTKNRGDARWYWDRGTNPEMLLDVALYSNWDTNSNQNDITKQCAYKQQGAGPGPGTWFARDCADTLPYICQKHRFDDSFNPSPNVNVGLPGGKWFIVISAVGGDGGVYDVEVRAQSSIKIASGYSNTIHSDFPAVEAYGGVSTNRIITHVTQQNEGWIPAYLMGAQVYYASDNSILEAVTYQQRKSCTYQFLSQTIYCNPDKPKGKELYTIHYGYDEFGFTYQRMTYSKCTRQLDLCGNGVFLGGVCVCDEMSSGDFCEIPRCINGGGLNPLTNKCTCPTGFSGASCQDTQCFSPSLNQISSDAKTFVLVLENTGANTNAINQLKANLPTILNNVNAKWFQQYVTVTYDSLGAVPSFQLATTINEFRAQLNNVVQNDNSQGCSFPMLNALIFGLNQINNAQSVVYVVARGGTPSDPQNLMPFTNLLTQKGPQIYLNYAGQDGACPLNLADPVTSNLQQLALASNGNIMPSTAIMTAALAKITIPLFYQGGVVANPSRFNNLCTVDKRYITIDSSTQTISVFVFGQAVTVTAIDAHASPVQFTTSFVDNVAAGPKLTIFTVSQFYEFGTWTFTIIGNGACFSQIRTTGSAEIYTGYIPVLAANPGLSIHMDNITSIPMADRNIIVATVVNDKARVTYVEMLNLQTNEFQYLKFYRREHCTFKWYSDPFSCTSGPFVMKFFGIDISGFTFVRDSFTACVGYVAPTGLPTLVPPPMTTTLAPGVPTVIPATTIIPPILPTRGNIYIILDTSSAVPQPTYSTVFANFFQSVFSSFQINSQFVNVALGTSPGDNNLETYPQFNQFSSLASLVNAIQTSYTMLLNPQSPGQSSLIASLSTASNKNFLLPWDATAFPHTIIYVTTNSVPSADAINLANQIRGLGKFPKILTIAYQYNGDATAFNKFSSNCYYNPADMAALNALATKLSGQISTASATGAEIIC